MDAGTTVIRYRQDRLVRWVLDGAGPLMLGLWIAVIIQTGETDLLPIVVLLSIAIGLGAWWIGEAPCVVLTPDALVIRTLRGTDTLRWSDISALERRMNVVWAMTRRGWFVLPVSGSRVAAGRPDGIGSLGDQVWTTWLERRGKGWGYTGLDPWSPTLDVRGRAVLRPPLLPRLGVLMFALNALAWSLIPYATRYRKLSVELGGAALVFAVTLVGAIGYHLWARVTVSDHEIVTRSLTRGVTRIRRSEVLEIRECTGRGWFIGRTVTQLGVLVAEHRPPPDSGLSWSTGFRVVPLAAPVSVTLAWANDPAYYRIWTWLHDELLDDDAPTPADPSIESASDDVVDR